MQQTRVCQLDFSLGYFVAVSMTPKILRVALENLYKGACDRYACETIALTVSSEQISRGRQGIAWGFKEGQKGNRPHKPHIEPPDNKRVNFCWLQVPLNETTQEKNV